MTDGSCGNCGCPIDGGHGESGSSPEYCYVCDAMKSAAYENQYMRRLHEREEQQRSDVRKRLGLEGS